MSGRQSEAEASASVAAERGKTSVPPPGSVDLPVPNVGALLRRNATEYADRPAVLFEDVVWTHAEFAAHSRQWARVFEQWRPAAGPFHVGVLMDNVPGYLAALGGAAIAGAALVGLNPTRRGSELARDINHVDLCGVVVEDKHSALIDEVRSKVSAPIWALDEVEKLAVDQSTDDTGVDHPAETVWCLIFTSGTSAAPKAVICSQKRMLTTGERMRIILDVHDDDVGYLSMPLFHSNSLMVGLMPALIAGGAVALARKFTASGWLRDTRRFGVTYWNYTGKPLAYLLATPEQPDDADNPVRRAYGNEGSDAIVAAFARRFGVDVIDAFGPTEGGIGIVRSPDDPAGSLGHAGDNVKVVDEDGRELPRAQFDESGRLTNADEAVGEIVNTAGPGPFEGYYNNPEATERATRGGWYWSGDLGYVDQRGYVYFAGRTADWLRVDGENFPAAPIEAALRRHPNLLDVAVYGVPDAQAGDQVMAALVLRDGGSFDPADFARWVDAQPELAPKWRPRYVRVATELPRTPTHKVLHRALQQQKFRLDRVGGDSLFFRGREEPAYREFTTVDEQQLRAEFIANERERFWDL